MTTRIRRLVRPIALAVVVPVAIATPALLAPAQAETPTAAVAVEQERAAARDRDRGRKGAAPLVIAHRGASGYRPEHTLAAYRLAIAMGADYIEPDLVSTSDGVLVARHENEISGTTDVADRPEFADRRTTKVIDGVSYTGWFTEDFTLAELKTLRVKERLPQVRPGNTRYDGRFEIPTFAEVLQLVRDESRRTGRKIGVAPETKHPTYHDGLGLSLEEPLLRDLRRATMDRKNAPVLIQSFEDDNLRELDRRTKVALEQLVTAAQADERLTNAGLRDIATYAEWVGPEKSLVLPRDPATGATGAPSSVVARAHAVGLKVVVYTIRDENQFMATNFRRGTDPNALGNVRAEIQAFLDAGVDAFFADQPDSAVDARDDWLG